MKPQEMTLAELVGPDKGAFALSNNLRTVLAEQQEKLKLATSVPRKSIEDKMVERAASLFDLKVIDLLLGGWKEYRELQQFADPKQYPPEETVKVPLVEHEVVSEHHPALEVTVGGVHVCRVDLDLTISLSVDGCVLGIQGGKIKQLTVASCRGRTVLARNGTDLIKAESKNIALGGPITLRTGITLG